MRTGFLVMFIIALVFGGSYWYYIAQTICPIPMGYHIGSIDPRFKISSDEVRKAVSVAESMWETKTGKNLFTMMKMGS